MERCSPHHCPGCPDRLYSPGLLLSLGRSTPPSTPEALRGTSSRAKAQIAPHSLAMLLARSRIETIPTTASSSITGRWRNPPKSI